MNFQKITVERNIDTAQKLKALNIILELQAKFADSLVNPLVNLEDFFDMISTRKTKAGDALIDLDEIIFGKSGSHIWISADDDKGEFTPTRFIIITNR